MNSNSELIVRPGSTDIVATGSPIGMLCVTLKTKWQNATEDPKTRLI